MSAMPASDFSLGLEPHGTLSIECVENGPIQTNTYFVISGGEAVVIDPAWEGEELARHFSVRHPEARIMALVCTHGHADHTGGVAGLRRALGDNVPFVIAADDVETARDHVGWLRQAWGIDTEQPPVPDRLLTEGDCIEFGDVSLQAIATDLSISVRMVQRYVTSIYEKTGAKSRTGLHQRYTRYMLDNR